MTDLLTDHATDGPPASPAPVAPTAPSWAPLLIVLAGTFVTFLDFFIVNVGLPSIAADLHAGPASVSLVVAGYGITFAVGMITGGRLGDLYGRRRMFLAGLALFTLTSLACGLAPTITVLVAARVLQGAAGALLTPQVLAVVGSVYDGDRRATAFAAYGFAMGLAGVLGQLVGGALITADPDGLSWRTIFLINVPVGLVVLPLARRVLPESRGERTRLDLTGVALISAAVVALVLPLVEGREHGWPAWCWVSFALAPVLAAEFVLHQRRRVRRGHAPLIDPVLFRARSYAAGSFAAFTFALVPSSFFFVLALYLQDGRGYGPLFSGLVFAALGAGYFVAMVLATPVAVRLGRQVLTLGAVLAGVGCAGLVASAHAASAAALLPGLASVGAGIGFVLVPVSSMVLADTDLRHAGAAAGALATAQQVGGAIGVAVISTVYFAGHDAIGSFRTSLLVVIGLAALTALAAQLLPPRRAAVGPAGVDR